VRLRLCRTGAGAIGRAGRERCVCACECECVRVCGSVRVCGRASPSRLSVWEKEGPPSDDDGTKGRARAGCQPGIGSLSTTLEPSQQRRGGEGGQTVK